jgi:hypothetical protein
MIRREAYDWPEEPRRRRPRVEYLEPERRAVLRVTVHRHSDAQRWIIGAALFASLLILLQSPILLVLLAGLALEHLAAVAFIAAVVVFVAVRERWHRRPF